MLFSTGQTFGDLSEFTYSLIVMGTPTAEVKSPASISLSAAAASSSSSGSSSAFKGHSGHGHRQCTIRIAKAEKNVTPSGKVELIPSITYILS